VYVYVCVYVCVCVCVCVCDLGVLHPRCLSYYKDSATTNSASAQ
jgi:hypothetical protein